MRGSLDPDQTPRSDQRPVSPDTSGYYDNSNVDMSKRSEKNMRIAKTQISLRFGASDLHLRFYIRVSLDIVSNNDEQVIP